MTITRQSLFDEISRCDASIAEYNEDKAGAFEAYREQLKAEGRSTADVAAEITAWKKAYRRFRALDKDADAVLEQDALVDEIVAELKTGTIHATRARASRTTKSEPAVHSSLAFSDADKDGATRLGGKTASRFSSPSASVGPGREPADVGRGCDTAPASVGLKTEAAPLGGSSGDGASGAAMAVTVTPGHPDNLDIPEMLRRDENNFAPWMGRSNA